jgi:hypothetical protein
VSIERVPLPCRRVIQEKVVIHSEFPFEYRIESNNPKRVLRVLVSNASFYAFRFVVIVIRNPIRCVSVGCTRTLTFAVSGRVL